MKANFGSGMKPRAPKAGANGPNDKGGGTKTYKPPMPKPKPQGMK